MSGQPTGNDQIARNNKKGIENDSLNVYETGRQGVLSRGILTELKFFSTNSEVLDLWKK